jgi:flagellar M-ring protein FliF
MADSPLSAASEKPSWVAEVLNSPKLGSVLTIIAVIALATAAILWNQPSNMKVLYGNLADRDGGAVISALQQMNIPYKFNEGGNILVPAEKVHEARLALAAQGLPKGGTVGLEVMESQKLGTSQFQEQVNFQRGLEGELARTIQALSAVEFARVHLGLSKPTVFLKDTQKPTASVLVHLKAGRVLDRGQVLAIVHLVSNSVADLPAGNVSVVDQNGALLSESPMDPNALKNDSQLKYTRDIEDTLKRRVEALMAPLVGAENIRAQVSVDIDFTRVERANEAYKPNADPKLTAIRTQQSSETRSNDGTKSGGVPGALSNQPPANAQLKSAGTNVSQNEAASSTNESKDSKTQFELDRELSYTQSPGALIKRLSLAVVINHKKQVDDKGVVTYRPFSEDEQKQFSDLIQNAVGFDKERGDSVSISNTPFELKPQEQIPELPLWKQPENIELAKEIGRYLLTAVVAAYIWFGYVRPNLRRLAGPPIRRINPELEALRRRNEEEAQRKESEELVEAERAEMERLTQKKAEASFEIPADQLQTDLDLLKQVAKDNPTMLAGILKNWVNE